MGQRILLCCCREFRQTADGNTEAEYLFIFYQTDMPQRKQCPGVQIALFPRLLGAGFAEQTALRRVEIKGRAVVSAAVAAVDQLRQKSHSLMVRSSNTALMTRRSAFFSLIM